MKLSYCVTILTVETLWRKCLLMIRDFVNCAFSLHKLVIICVNVKDFGQCCMDKSLPICSMITCFSLIMVLSLELVLFNIDWNNGHSYIFRHVILSRFCLHLFWNNGMFFVHLLIRKVRPWTCVETVNLWLTSQYQRLNWFRFRVRIVLLVRMSV